MVREEGVHHKVVFALTHLVDQELRLFRDISYFRMKNFKSKRQALGLFQSLRYIDLRNSGNLTHTQILKFLNNAIKGCDIGMKFTVKDILLVFRRLNLDKKSNGKRVIRNSINYLDMV